MDSIPAVFRKIRRLSMPTMERNVEERSAISDGKSLSLSSGIAGSTSFRCVWSGAKRTWLSWTGRSGP